VVAQLAKERSGPAIRYQVLMYPVTDSSMSSRRMTSSQLVHG